MEIFFSFFLGCYVGRGKQKLQIIILLVLMKLRWPEDVVLLRSNHGTMELMNASNIPITSRQNLFSELIKMTHFFLFTIFCQKMWYQLLYFRTL
ncbi:unnamed protein product [Brugia timori]|uniref:Secreted protein n=1 Tax=Brugia timori TaxID=42155 RepID=A0A0R3QVF3_9BILA|nr:unnamed protein product [Brugia timori]